jgi:hypothetical protein
MSDKLKCGSTVGRDVDINGVWFRERILRNAVTVADWATARLGRDVKSDSSICELYADYESYCRRESQTPLPRKVWIATMKLAGFETQSGAFVGLLIQ